MCDGTTDTAYLNEVSCAVFSPASSIFWGHEGGIEILTKIIDPAAERYFPATTYQCANGTLPLPANPILLPTITGTTPPAFAYDPYGDNCNGSLWIANFSSDIVGIDISGNVLQVIPCTGNQWSANGLAFDALSGNLWVNSSPNAGDLREPDITIPPLAETGNIIRPTTWTAIQGGLDRVLGCTDMAFGLVTIDQDTPDYAALHRVHLYPQQNGALEPRIELKVDLCKDNVPGTYSYSSEPTQGFKGGSNLSWRWNIASGSPFAGAPTMILADILGDATVQADPLGGIIPELTSPHFLSVPASVALVLGGGTGLGGLSGLVVPLWPGGVVAWPPDFGQLPCSDAPGSLGARPGDAISIQTLYVNSGVFALCSGPYRNGSDATCGLIYDSSNTYAPGGAQTVGYTPTASCGFTATNPTTTNNKCRTVSFASLPASSSAKPSSGTPTSARAPRVAASRVPSSPSPSTAVRC